MNNLAGQIWQTLASIDLSSQTEKKGKLTYLSWTWAWGSLMNHYPDTAYEFSDRTFSDGSMEITCVVTITEGDQSVTRSMWLAVMDNRNDSILSPDSTDINKSKMRCLTKCIGMFGLGHYIYAGEDLPDQTVVNKVQAIAQEERNKEYNDLATENALTIKTVKEGIESGEYSGAAEAWFELTEEEQMGLWKAHSKGGVFTTSEQKIIKTSEFRMAYYGEGEAA
jgi:hypothetical protein